MEPRESVLVKAEAEEEVAALAADVVVIVSSRSVGRSKS